MKPFSVTLLVMVCVLQSLAGERIVVPTNQPTVAAALDRAQAGDTVFLLKGTHRGPVVLRDGVALIGESVASTILRGRGSGAVVKGADGALLRSLTIENGEKGILCENVAMTIEYVCVRDNKGTGIHCLVALPMIRNNVVLRNRESGIFCETVRGHNTIIEHNALIENGYCGIMLAGTSEIVVQNNVFFGNKQFGIFVSEGARRSRILYNDFYMNRDRYNVYANADRSNISVDPGYRGVSPQDLFGARIEAFKGKGKGGATIGLLSARELSGRTADVDGDGVPDDRDQCVSIPEDLDGFQDEDGCPDFDNDGDGIYDSQDQCPNEAEDRDGFQDEDGCPDTDNDGDGIPDSTDACPNSPETVNGYKDEDGCPDQLPPGFEAGVGQVPQDIEKDSEDVSSP